jgi:hypothetical protein
MLPFCHTILLWSVRAAELVNYAIIGTKCMKLIGCKFPPTVSSKGLNRVLELCFNQSCELLEDGKCIRLVLKEVDPSEFGKLINQD